jgi:hypothetical protein
MKSRSLVFFHLPPRDSSRGSSRVRAIHALSGSYVHRASFLFHLWTNYLMLFLPFNSDDTINNRPS